MTSMMVHFNRPDDINSHKQRAKRKDCDLADHVYKISHDGDRIPFFFWTDERTEQRQTKTAFCFCLPISLALCWA